MLSSYILRMARFGNETAFIEQGHYRAQFYSYQYVVERARAFSSWLLSHDLGADGVREAPRILLWAAPGARWAIAFYGCILAEAVAVPIDTGFSLEFLNRVAERTHAALLVTDRALLARHANNPVVIQQFFTDDINALPSSSAESCPATQSGRDSLVEIVYTSGSTAEPRGVMITQGNLLANLEPVEREIRRYEKLSIPFRPIRFMHLIPLSHLFGQVMGLFIPQLLRGIVIFPETQTPARLARIIHERKTSVMVCVPQQLEALGDWARAQIPGSDGGNSDSIIEKASAEHWPVLKRWWRFRRLHSRLGWKMWAFVVGGAALSTQTERRWNALGYAVVQGYGLTETAPAIAITHPFKIHRGSVGRPLAGVETRIADDGEILVRGANVSPGYYKDARATEEGFSQGWLHTGDLGKFDEQGNLIYLGRKREVIVTAEGLNVFPEDIETVLREQPAIQEAAVVGKTAGLSSAPRGEYAESGRTLVHAVLVPAPGASQQELEAAVSQANSSLEPHQRIRGFSIWPEPSLPRTLSTLKLQRTKIAAWVNGEAASQSLSLTVAKQNGDWKDLLVQLGTPPERIRPEARLAEDLGVSSLDRVELLTWLESHGYSFDEVALAQAQTVADLERLIRASSDDATAAPVSAKAEKQQELRRMQIPVPGAAHTQVRAALAEPRWPVSAPARIARGALQMLLAFPLLRFYVKSEVYGIEKLRNLHEPALFISNHQSLFDVPLIVRSLPRRIRRCLAPAMGEGALRGHSKMAVFWARLGFNGYVISDDPAKAQEALRHAGWLAEKGCSTLLFPEGGRTWDGKLQRFRPGVGVIAERLRLPVVPLLIEGLFAIWPRTQKRPVHGKARVSVGELTRIHPGESAADFTRRLEEYYRAWRPGV